MEKIMTAYRNILLIILSLALGACQEDGEFHQQSIAKNIENAPIAPRIVDPVEKPQPKTEVFTESFIQEEKLKGIDILWVIDDSGSMKDEQEALGYNFDAFINNFITRDVNFKMAITTTDVSLDRAGKMVAGSAEKLTSAMAKQNPEQFKTDFKNLVNVGIKGSGDEQGLAAFAAFMDKHGANFARPDAFLAVIILSDEPDHSPLSSAEYINKLKSFKKEAGLVKIYSIIDPKYGTEEKYHMAAASSGGSVASIKGDFYLALNDIGTNIYNLLDSFPLSHAAKEESLRVKVAGIDTVQYSYDDASHTIRFNQGFIPKKGAKIEVSYEKK
jgi:hypothetical protein